MFNYCTTENCSNRIDGRVVTDFCDICKKVNSQFATIKLLVGALEDAKVGHNYCEDSWFSCPKAPEGCANDYQGEDCNCGAEEHNNKIDQALKEVE